MSVDNEENEQKIINEEYKIWKKNSSLLYDLVLSSSLSWPSLTVQWLPDKKIISGDKDNSAIAYSIQRLILGTHTNETEDNHLLIAQITLPHIKTDSNTDLSEINYNDLHSSFGGSAGKLEIIQTIKHPGEVNRARYMPQNPNIIATKSKYATVNIYDRRKYTLKSSRGDKCEPTIRLTGHTKEGYGLSWSTYREGLILSSADDESICMWDITKCGSKSQKELHCNATNQFKSHTDKVEDVCWHKCGDPNSFISVGDDKKICMWDVRNNQRNQASHVIVDAHKLEINSCAYSPFNEHLFLTAGNDKIVALWDRRKTKNKLHSMEGHTKEIYKVDWSPHSEVHCASSAADRRVCVWDLSMIGHEQQSDDAEDGPPELLFVHGGHTDKVIDFSWNENDPWVISSIANNNIVQIWQMTEEMLLFEDPTAHVQLE